MSYEKQHWVNDITPLNASRMNHIEDGIENAHSSLEGLATRFGSPLIASTASQMVDTTRSYVYVGSESGYTNGNWYYYNGTTWVSGGVYQSNGVETDTSLTQSDIPADAKATGDRVTVIEGAMADKVSYGYVEDGVAYFTNGEDTLFSITGIGGGGGGGSSNNAIITATNTSWVTKSISTSETCSISFTWSSLENETPTGQGTMAIRVNGVTKVNRSINQGSVTVDITDYLTVGPNTVRVTIADVYNNTKSLNYSVEVINLTISSTFNDASAYSGSFNFPYTPVGAVSKHVMFYMDNVLLGYEDITASGRQYNYTIPAQEHGAHKLEVYFTASINSETVESNHLVYSIICIEQGETDIIISTPFASTSVAQYTMVSIPYYVYNPSAIESPVLLKVDGTTVSTQTVGREKQIWTYRADTTGSKTLTIDASDGGVTATKTFTLTVVQSDIDIYAETQSLALHLTSLGRSNNETDPSVWSNNGVSATLSDFNYTSDGWLNDTEGNTVLRVTGDARVTIPYKLFGTDFKGTGKTMEFEFAVKDTRDYTASLISCMQGNRGILFTPMSVTLKSQQSTISTQYKDNEHVRIAFVAEPAADNRFLYCYINGIMTGVIQYPSSDTFSQQVPVDITIGSNSATIDIYNIRVYDQALTKYQVVTNWIADTQNVNLMLERYNRNNLFDANGNIVINKLPTDLPYLIIEGAVLPQFKGDKKTVNGSYVDPTDTSKSFTFTGAQIDVQGTSSQYYARKNYKIKFKNGFNMTESGETVSKYALRGSENSIPVSTFCFKADVASSEGANNVELARLYNDICPYKTPGQVSDSRVRQGIDGFPIVIFWNNGTSTTFLGKYNYNLDKGTEESYGFVSGDESWEIRNNTSNRVIWESDDYTGTAWLDDFEARYPDTDPPYEDPTQLAAMATWIKSTKNNPTKFKNELADHMEVDSVLFYYLFTELFLMVDSRAKNAFPSFMGGTING